MGSRYCGMGKQTALGTMDPVQKWDTFISNPMKAKHGTQIAPTSHMTMVKTREGIYEVSGTTEGPFEPEGMGLWLLENVLRGLPDHSQQGATDAWDHNWTDANVDKDVDYLTWFREEDLTARKVDALFVTKYVVNFPTASNPIMTYRAEWQGSKDSIAALDGSYTLSALAPFSSLDQVTTVGHQLAEAGDWLNIISASLEITNESHLARAQEGRFGLATRGGKIRVGGSITQRLDSTDTAKRFYDGTTANSEAQAAGITPFDMRLQVQSPTLIDTGYYYQFGAKLYACKWPESDWNVVQLDDITFVTPFISEYSNSDSKTFDIHMQNGVTNDAGTWPQTPA